ncbi:MAG: hypothetical protein AB1473_01675 [Thermodesulfobacteriota bacterium]
MIRIVAFTLAIVVSLSGLAFAQGGFLDSIFGPSGLGLWGGGYDQQSVQQYNSPGFYGAPNPAQQSYGQWPGQQPDMGYQQQMGYQQPAPYYPQPGYGETGPYPSPGATHPDWYQQQQQQQYTQTPPPPVEYGPAPVQTPAPAPPQVRAARPAQPAPRAAARPAPGRGQDPGAQIPRDEALPSGAVKITTITPQGTRVEYYPPPPGMEQPDQAAVRPQRRPAATRTPAQTERKPEARRIAPSPSAADSSGSSIAMPSPVQVPKGQDPRSGWGAAVDRGPRAPVQE